MIILDTNVISELMHGERADSRVVRWSRAHHNDTVTTVINRAEILAGIETMPDGRRKEGLRTRAEALFFSIPRVLPLVDDCAPAYADITNTRRRLGLPIGGMDALIASIARVDNAAVATRDIGGFDGIGLTLVNPWEA
ncbi:MAG: type II toxin-antitoxin system VapC family toxin [Aeromicrobium sp.]|uniref:type II toxin-antitoxin system VapC family toxin n=1 Tax=Aeromicrobium sp. TaxID=1871063 RepID=UPI0039E6BB5D